MAVQHQCQFCAAPGVSDSSSSSVRAKMSLNSHNTHHSSSCCLGSKSSQLYFNSFLIAACLSTPSAPVCWSRASGCTSTGVWDVEDGGVGGQPWSKMSDSCVSAACEVSGCGLGVLYAPFQLWDPSSPKMQGSFTAATHTLKFTDSPQGVYPPPVFQA